MAAKEAPKKSSKSSKKLEVLNVNARNCDDVASEITLQLRWVLGRGSFGVVREATVVQTSERVAIKRVMQDSRFKNRELRIMKQMHHCNVVALRYYFYSLEEDTNFLNLVMEFVPEALYRISRHYTKIKQALPWTYIKLFTYQICRAVAHLHRHGICHRDLKPQNMLVDPAHGILKICDLGSAKRLRPNEPSVAYICSRYYRAPELIFGATVYTNSIDMWSVGCVFAELIIGRPVFLGESGVDQLVKIIQILGTPTTDEILSMNPNSQDYKFPAFLKYPWRKVFPKGTPQEALDFAALLLRYSPTGRLGAFDCLEHPLFDSLREDGLRLPNGRALPVLFNYTAEELEEGASRRPP